MIEVRFDVFGTFSKPGKCERPEVDPRQQLFEIENSLKSFEGQYSGLSDTTLLARKLRWEREFRAKVNADPKKKFKWPVVTYPDDGSVRDY